MHPPEPSPKLPMWIFFATDAALLGAAWFIAARSAQPLTPSAMAAIVACVVAGAIVALVPLVVRYERQKNEQLDERQQALEALGRTVTASAEQISIAAGGLHGIAELAQKNLRHAEQLPHKLHEKIAEFQAGLATVNDAEKEELERELTALRTTESDRLDTISDRIAKSTHEWARLEAATHQHLSAASESFTRLSADAKDRLGQAQSDAAQALSKAVRDATDTATKAIDAARAAAWADFESKLGAATALAEKFSGELAARLDTAAGAKRSSPTGDARQPAEDAAGPIAAAPKADEPDPTAAAEEPPPVPASRITQIEPVVPETSDPFPNTGAEKAPAAVAVAIPDSPAPLSTAPAPEKMVAPLAEPRRTEPSRKRAARKAAPAPDPALELGIETPTVDRDSSDAETAGAGLVERVRTSDGATRLLATAYIGIGNRLFIRGDGPGLSWEKGVPLQFVSIGKWRWETNDATGPVAFKLYKNDDVECAALGTQRLDPEYQQEVVATF